MAIQLKRNTTSGIVPDPAELVSGELAINTADAKLFAKKNDGTVVEIGGGGGSAAQATPFVIPSANRYRSNMVTAGSYTTLSMTANRIYFSPIIFPMTWSCVAIGSYVTTAGSGASGRVGVYASDSDGYPTGSPLVATGDYNASTTGLKEDTSATYTFTAGTQYWLATTVDATFTLRAIPRASMYEMDIVPLSAGGNVGFYWASWSFALGFPSIVKASLINLSGNFPAVYFKG